VANFIHICKWVSIFVEFLLKVAISEVIEELFVDSSSAETRVEIHFDVSFDKLPCSFLSVDIMDVSACILIYVKAF
jgi:hypothetical protein